MDPPPDYCFKIPPTKFCKLTPQMCGLPDNDTQGLSDLMTSSKIMEGLGKVLPGTDLTDFPPRLIPLIKLLGKAAKQADIDFNSNDIEGLTFKLHYKK